MAEVHRAIVDHYERCLERHGDSHLGVDWPDPEGAKKRYRVMLEVIREPAPAPTTVLDFGCGASHLYEFIRESRLDHIRYAGLDLSEKFVALSRRKFPENTYFCCDILADDASLPSFDYVMMNGVFTEKCDLTYEQMLAYFKRMIPAVFALADKGVAFNTMSKHVDWERDDLFHVPFDDMASFLRREVTRHFIFRADYGLFEYSTYAYR